MIKIRIVVKYKCVMKKRWPRDTSVQKAASDNENVDTV